MSFECSVGQYPVAKEMGDRDLSAHPEVIEMLANCYKQGKANMWLTREIVHAFGKQNLDCHPAIFETFKAILTSQASLNA